MTKPERLKMRIRRASQKIPALIDQLLAEPELTADDLEEALRMCKQAEERLQAAKRNVVVKEVHVSAYAARARNMSAI